MIGKSGLTDLFLTGVNACLPEVAMDGKIPDLSEYKKAYLLGFGKAAVEMVASARAQVTIPVEGVAITRHGYGNNQTINDIEIMHASHPVPDESCKKATLTLIEILEKATENDVVIFLVSGGGSSLLCAPAEGISLVDKKSITKQLLFCGASISEINKVRPYLSRVKGGRLISRCACPNVMSFLISDVVGDNPQAIASGPTVNNSTDINEVLSILAKYDLDVSENIIESMRANSTPEVLCANYDIISKSSIALDTIERTLERGGWQVENWGDALEGEAQEVGRHHAELINRLALSKGKYAFISGGELTVTINNPNGAGGPNLEYLLGLLSGIDKKIHFEALACDTDGVDGSEDNAGGYVNTTTLDRSEDAGLSVSEQLQSNQSYEFFKTINDLVVTGPTGTNVNDIRIILMYVD